jgi:hypothetical protein
LPLRQETPELGVMPAELVPRAVPVGANALAELPHFLDQRFARHAEHIVVHRLLCLRDTLLATDLTRRR